MCSMVELTTRRVSETRMRHRSEAHTRHVSKSTLTKIWFRCHARAETIAVRSENHYCKTSTVEGSDFVVELARYTPARVIEAYSAI
jgi:hypothetical protein